MLARIAVIEELVPLLRGAPANGVACLVGKDVDAGSDDLYLAGVDSSEDDPIPAPTISRHRLATCSSLSAATCSFTAAYLLSTSKPSIPSPLAPQKYKTKQNKTKTPPSTPSFDPNTHTHTHLRLAQPPLPAHTEFFLRNLRSLSHRAKHFKQNFSLSRAFVA